MHVRLSQISFLYPYILLAMLVVSASTVALLNLELKLLVSIIGLILIAVIWVRPEYGILLFLTTFLVNYGQFFQPTGKLTPNNLLGAIFCILLMHHFIQNRDLWFLRMRQVQILAAIGALFLITAWFEPSTPYFASEMDRTTKEIWDFFTYLAFVVFMIHFIKTPSHVQAMWFLLLALILLAAVSSIPNSLSPGADYRASAALGIRMAGNSNYLAFCCLIGIATLWHLYQSPQSALLRSLYIGGIALLAFVVFLTASRSALINLAFLIVILAVEAGINPKRIFLTLVAFAGLVLFIIAVAPKQNLQRMASLQADQTQSEATSSMESRILSLRTGIQMFFNSNPLLGVGPGNFRWIRVLDYDHRRLATHNSYLWALVSGGVPMLLGYLVLFWVTWRDLRWLERQPRTAQSGPLWLMKTIRTTMLLFLVFSLFTEIWLEIFLFLIIGFTIVMKRLCLNEQAVAGAC